MWEFFWVQVNNQRQYAADVSTMWPSVTVTNTTTPSSSASTSMQPAAAECGTTPLAGALTLSPGTTESDKLATCLYKAAQRHLPGHRLRTDYSDGDPDFEKPFYILKHTYCAAVLTENGFMDSEVSLSFLESEEGKKTIVALHVEGIEEYVMSIV